MDDPKDDIDCRRAHELISRQMDGPLSAADRARLKVHLAVCDLCVLVERQLQSLREAIRRL